METNEPKPPEIAGAAVVFTLPPPDSPGMNGIAITAEALRGALSSFVGKPVYHDTKEGIKTLLGHVISTSAGNRDMECRVALTPFGRDRLMLDCVLTRKPPET